MAYEFKKYNEDDYSDVVNARTEKDSAYDTYKNMASFNYTQSDETKNAYGNWQNLLSQGSPQDSKTYAQAVEDAYNALQNREKFSYDLNGDALYQQYKDQYMTQGNMAMMDTMGQAAAMTGGYGNSYAQTVGQQTYQGYLQQLNDRIPELYQLAMSKYQMEGDQLRDNYSLASDMRQREYGEYRDALSDYNTNVQNAQNLYLTLDDQGYNRQYNEYGLEASKNYNLYNIANDAYQNLTNLKYNEHSDLQNLEYSDYWNDTNLQYQKDRDKVADEKWQKTYDLQKDSAYSGNNGSVAFSVPTAEKTAFYDAIENGQYEKAESLVNDWLASGLDKGTAMSVYGVLFPEEYHKKWGIVDTSVNATSQYTGGDGGRRDILHTLN